MKYIPSLATAGYRRPSAVMSSLGPINPTQKALLQEQCILVDENDIAIGNASKEKCHLRDKRHGDSLLHRAFSLFMFNEKMELLMQQRSRHKITFPAMWTNTCCHPLAGSEEEITQEGFGAKQAAQRKMLNELGVPADHCPISEMIYLTRILYSAPSSGMWAEHELDYILVLRAKSAIPLSPNPNEVMNFEYVSKEHINEFITTMKHEGEGVTPWFELIANSLLPKWWDNIDNIEIHQDHKNIRRFY